MRKLMIKLECVALVALLVFSLPMLAATPTITGVVAQQRYPWNGKFDISYTASGVDAACQAQNLTALLKVFAVEQTTHVTNVAENAYLSGDTTMADGTHKFVWDMDAQGIFQGLVSTNFEVFVVAEAEPLDGVQLWENGPYWAECNVGADKPEEYGYYFWWGDTVGYTNTGSAWVSVKDGTEISFTLSTPPLFLPSPASLTYSKDNASLLSEGYIDSKGNLVAEHDAATAHLGGPWRMPTGDEIQALFDNCTWSWMRSNGISGRLFTGRDKYASKSIFLPAAGYGSGSSLCDLGSEGDYWSSTPDSGNSNLAREFYFLSNLIYRFSYSSRCSGQSVRPLRSKEVLHSNRSGVIRADLRTGTVRAAATTETLTYSTEWGDGGCVTLAVDGTALGDARMGSGTIVWTPPSKEGMYVLTHTVVAGGVEEVLSASFYVLGVAAQQRYPWNGKFDIEYTMNGVDAVCKAQNLTASFKVFAVEQTTHVTNVAKAAYLSGDMSLEDGTHWFVWDMDAQGIFKGLVSTNFEVFVSVEATIGVQLWENGPYWAECNVGSTKPEGYGYYFWWGDTVGYTNTGNAWISVKDGTTISFSKSSSPANSSYCKDKATLLSEGYVDFTGNLVAAHDAATAHLGSPWRMPTSDEIQVLVNNCETSWITTNGVSGYLVTGKGTYASKRIFLPAAGSGDDSLLSRSGLQGFFWSSTPFSGVSDYACYLYFYSNRTFQHYGGCRFYGHPVRPLRGVAQPKKVLYSHRSGAIRADLRTSDVRIAAATEVLTYSTAWNGGEAVTLAANGTTLTGATALTGSGTYVWTPSDGGAYTLTHTVVAGGVPMVLSAYFTVPIQMGGGACALIDRGTCTLYAENGSIVLTKEMVNAIKSSAVTNLVIGKGITGVGANAFENFWHLADVTLGEDCTNVFERAFKKCYGLTNVMSQATGPMLVNDYAFSGCHSLQNLMFAGLPTFGKEAYTFQTTIYMKDGGIPEVYAMPTITIPNLYQHVMGKKTLDDADWTDVTNFTDDQKKDYHFFKIEMKAVEGDDPDQGGGGDACI